MTATVCASANGSKATGPVAPKRCQAVFPCGSRSRATVTTARCGPDAGGVSRRTAPAASERTGLLAPSAATTSRASIRSPPRQESATPWRWTPSALTSAGATSVTRSAAQRHRRVVKALFSTTQASGSPAEKCSAAAPSCSHTRIASIAPNSASSMSPTVRRKPTAAGVSARLRASNPKRPRWRTGGCRSINATRRPSAASANAAAKPTTPPPHTATS